jgi:hypothetical protein
VGKQLAFDLRISRHEDGTLRMDAGFPIDWKALDRRARRRMAALVMQGQASVLHDGFSVRRYADDAALLETLRSRMAGKQLKQAARKTGKRLPVKAAVLMAVSPEGRKLHALVDRIEERVATREAVALCG